MSRSQRTWRPDDMHGGKKGKQSPQRQVFIPGLLDDIVLEHIVTKIPWKTLFTLSWVNRRWRGAIRNREIYDARKRCLDDASQSMVVLPVGESMVVFPVGASRFQRRAGFCDVENRVTYLFPLSGILQKGVSSPNADTPAVVRRPFSQEIPYKIFPQDRIEFLDGKLYFLSQFRAPIQAPKTPGKQGIVQEIQVLDVGACEWEWKTCCTSFSRKYAETCVVCDGKIYWFHIWRGLFYWKVFDPETNKVSDIRPKRPNVLSVGKFNVAVLDKKIYVKSVQGENMMIFDSVMEKWDCPKNTPNTIFGTTDRHRTWLSRPWLSGYSMIGIRNKMYELSGSQVEVCDPESSSWTLLQEAFHEDFMDQVGVIEEVEGVTRYGNELIAVLRLSNGFTFQSRETEKLCKSRDFNVEGKKLTWTDFYENSPSQFLCNYVRFRFGHLKL